MATETPRRADGRSAHPEFDFLPAEPLSSAVDGHRLNESLTLAVEYVLRVYGCVRVAYDWRALEEPDRFSFLVLVCGECSGDYASRENELAFIFRNLSVLAKPAVLDFLDTVRTLWWVDGDCHVSHAADVEENWGDLLAGLRVARTERGTCQCHKPYALKCPQHVDRGSR